MLVTALIGCVGAALLVWGRPLLRLYAAEPVAGGIPSLTALLILLTPQMADMMAAISGGRGLDNHYDEAWWHQTGFGLFAGLLGFQGWFWMRAALNARVNLRDTRRPDEMSWPERWAPRLVLLPALLIALSPLIVAAEGRIPWSSVPVFGVGLAVLTTGLLLLFIWRRRVVLPVARYDGRPLPRLRSARLIAASPFHPGVALVSIAVGLVGFVLPLAFPDFVNDLLHTAAATLLAMSCLIPVAAMLLAVFRDVFDWLLERFSARHRTGAARRTGTADILGTIALIALPLLGGWVSESNGIYDVAPRRPLADRPTVGQAITAFAGCGDPVIAVIEGGASRSAAWGLSMMAALDEATGDRFSRHLFAISAVSGGSLAATTYGLVRSHAAPASKIWAKAQTGLVELARADLLSTSVSRMLTTDALTGIPSRASALSHAFEHVWSWDQGFDIPDIQHGRPLFQTIHGTAPCSPHFLLNGTDSRTGSRIITSTVAFENDTIFSDSVDALGVSGADVSLADAVLNSARFPFISPPGRMLMSDRTAPPASIVDGGVFEAVGARTAHELALALIRMNQHPIVVVIRNGGDETAEAPLPCAFAKPTPQAQAIVAEAAGKARGVYVPEFLTSLLGINAARGAHGRAELAALRTSLCPNDFYDFDLPALNGNLGEPGVPMNWVLDRRNCELLLGDARTTPRNLLQVANLAKRLGSDDVDPKHIAVLIDARQDAARCRLGTGATPPPLER